MKKLLLIAFILSFALVSCESDKTDVTDPDDPSTTIFEGFDEEKLDQDLSTNVATTKSFTFTASEAWNISTKDVTKSSTWVTVEPMSGGAGDCEISIEIDENDGEESRSSTITIVGESGGTPIIITITQKGKEKAEEIVDTSDLPPVGDNDLGGKNNPYIIETAQDLIYLAQAVDCGRLYDLYTDSLVINSKPKAVDTNNPFYPGSQAGRYFVIGNDIDLENIEWEPIGDCHNYNCFLKKNSINYHDAEGRPFSGNFDGGGHTISGFNLNIGNKYHITGDQGYFGAGLFALLGTNGSISNLSIKGSVDERSSNNAYVYTGAIVGCSNGIITNCCNHTTIIGDVSAAGIVCESYGDVINCVNYGKISGESCVGGIVSRSSGAVENCVNKGKITTNGVAGGIVADKLHNKVVSNCENYAPVSGHGHVGGIVGWSHNHFLLNNCINYSSATISGSKEVGGIIGDSKASIVNCGNSAEIRITTENDDSVIRYIGGVVGDCSQGLVINCYNTGDITYCGGGYDYAEFIGGVAGKLFGPNTVKYPTAFNMAFANNYNSGQVCSFPILYYNNNSNFGGYAGDLYKNNNTHNECGYYLSGCISGTGIGYDDYSHPNDSSCNVECYSLAQMTSAYFVISLNNFVDANQELSVIVGYSEDAGYEYKNITLQRWTIDDSYSNFPILQTDNL